MSGAYQPCVSRNASAPLVSSTDRIRLRTLPFVIKANARYICMQHFKSASPQRSHGCQGDRISLDSASVQQLVRNRTDEAHVYSKTEMKVLVLCIVSGGLPRPLRSLSSSASRDSVPAAITVHNSRSVVDLRS